MSVSVTMPRLGESVSEGTVTRWLKKEGDHVEADEPLLEVSTDKVDTEIPSPAAGVLKAIKVGEDETVEVGSELAVIDEGGGGDAADTDSADEPQDVEQESPAEPEPEQESTQAESADEDKGAPPEAQQEPQRVPEEQGDAEGETAGSTRERHQVAADNSEDSDDSRDSVDNAEADGDGGGASYVTPLVRRLAAEHGVDLGSVHGTGVGGRIRKQDVLDAARSDGKQSTEQRAPKQQEPQRQQE